PSRRGQPAAAYSAAIPMGATPPSATWRFWQRRGPAVRGIKAGLIGATAAGGRALKFGASSTISCAHAELTTFGRRLAARVDASGGRGRGASLGFAGGVGGVAGGLLGGGLELGVWRPLRQRRTGNIALIVSSIGLALFLGHIYLVIFKGNPRSFEQYATQQQ